MSEIGILNYRTENGVAIELRLDGDIETIWATQEQIANIFNTSVTNISDHIIRIYQDEELSKDETLRKIRNVYNQTVNHYSLDIIIAVGYRVNSKKATVFRKWATANLSQYIRDGYVIDEKRLAQDPTKLNKLAAKIRELRNNEKNIYKAVRDCFKISAQDYDSKSKEIQSFYILLQDKFHYAVLGMTASKIILDRANHVDKNMGLQNIDGDVPTVEDIKTAKNYILPDELYRMHLLSDQFLLYAESMALRDKRMTMIKIT